MTTLKNTVVIKIVSTTLFIAEIKLSAVNLPAFVNVNL